MSLIDYHQKAKQLGPLTEDELSLNFDDKIFQDILKQYSFAKNPIALYDKWVEEILPKQITTRKQFLENGYNEFSNVKIIPSPIFPKEARDQKETYSATVTVTITNYPNAGNLGASINIKNNVEVCKIPLLVGSKYCKLYGLSDEQRIIHGECFNDRFGYFIIKGAEKIIVIQEQLAFSQDITYPDKLGRIETRFTSHTDIGTSLMTILLGKKWRTIKIKLFSYLGKRIPLFVMYYVLITEQYQATHEQVIDYALAQINQFVKEEDREKVKFALYPSIAKFNTIKDCWSYLLNKRTKIMNKKMEAAKKRKKNLNVEAMKDSKERIFRDILNDLFPNVQQSDKVEHLSMIIAKTVLCMLGIRASDNRDGWENKSLQAPAHALEQLFNALWTNFIEGDTKEGLPNINHQVITDGFISAFAPNGWGIKGSNRKENIVVALIRESVISVVSQILKCNTPTSRQLRDSKVRQITGSQNGYLCLPETPEGTNCGLTKNLASSCWISLQRNYTDFVNYIPQACGNNTAEFLSKDKTEQFPYPLTINGIKINWCNTDIIPRLKIIKRLPLFFDICICFNEIDSKVEVYLDGCRPCRPLYVTNPSTQQLIIDEIPDKENKSINELIYLGAIEFVHAREQENYLIAKIPNLVRTFTSDKIRLREELAAAIVLGQKTEDDLDEKLRVETNDKIKSDYYNALNNAKITNSGTKLLFEEKIAHPFYSHANIDPNAVLGITASTMPQGNFCQGPRFSYQCSMVKQSLGPFHSVRQKRHDTSFKCLLGPSRTLFETQIYESAGLNALPSGYTPIVAFLIRQNNNEDSIVVKKQFIERFMRIVKYTTHTITIANSTGNVSEELAKPNSTSGEKEGRYDCIDDQWYYLIVGAYIRRNDCIIGTY